MTERATETIGSGADAAALAERVVATENNSTSGEYVPEKPLLQLLTLLPKED